MTFFFGSNWKMNHDPESTRKHVAEIGSWLEHYALAQALPLQLWLTPSYPCLPAAVTARRGSPLWLGAQNVHWEDSGAFTGEVSVNQLKACGMDFVLIGHAERRTLFGETDRQISLKVRACAHRSLGVMLCVGETLDAYRAGLGFEYVTRQLQSGLEGLPNADRLLVLYEPVWSIGKDGLPADPVYVQQAFQSIRVVLNRLFPVEGNSVPIMYGGSVNADNAPIYATMTDCAGLGVGRAAWAANDFLHVLQTCLQKKLATTP